MNTSELVTTRAMFIVRRERDTFQNPIIRVNIIQNLITSLISISINKSNINLHHHRHIKINLMNHQVISFLVVT